MIDSRINKAILSPEDIATHRQWRRAVCALYAGVILVLAAVCGAHHFVTSGAEARIAAAPGLAAAAEAGHGEAAMLRH